jgi:DNA mismatch repair protein MSH4
VTEVVAARHPVLDKLKPESVVANDFSFYDGHNCMYITGPNMSGKTTFLREVALLQIMAQVGSFVPAKFAAFRLADRILSRMGLSDSIEGDASTAKAEVMV